MTHGDNSAGRRSTSASGRRSTCPPAPSAPAPGDRPSFTADVGEIFLCLQYDGMGEGRRMDVRWYRGAARAPMAVSNIQP